MKVVLFANSCWNLYNFRKDIIIDLLNKNYQVIIVAPKDDSLIELTKLGCHYSNINLSQYGTNILKELFSIFTLFFLFKKINPSYILSYTIKPNLYSAIICKFLKIRNICNVSGLGNSFLQKNLVFYITIFLYKFFLSSSYVIFFQNKDDLKIFKDYKILRKSNYYLIPGSGINLNFFKSHIKYNKSRVIDFLFIGRFIKAKGINEFCDACDIIIQKYPNINFVALTPTPENYNYYKTKYPKIKFLNFVPDVKDILDTTKCVVLPSYREGLPRCLLEACSMSIPIITSNSVGCRDIIIDGFNGFMCDSMSTDNLKDVLIKFHNLSFDNKLKMSVNARFFAEKDFNVKIIIDKYNEFMI